MTGHKLMPSVYGNIIIEPDGFGKSSKVTYWGLTFLAIRTSNHSSSTAKKHADNLKKTFELESFKSLAHRNTVSTNL